MTNIANHFRNAPAGSGSDKYGILSPLLATGDYVTKTKEVVTLFAGTSYRDMLKGKIKPQTKGQTEALAAYKTYLHTLPSHEQMGEKDEPFSTMLLALDSMAGNITHIEDSFPKLFGSVSNTKPETSVKSSSLVVIGYLEKADQFCTWVSALVEHLSAEGGDMIPPFRTKELTGKASDAADFAGSNLNKWNALANGFMSEVSSMTRKGTDLTIQSNGQWIDEYAHDSQFTADEQILMESAFRSPVMWVMTGMEVRRQDRIDLLSSRKDWLVAKIVLEQSKLSGMNELSPEYKRLKKAVNHYADLVSKYEQKIERIRG